MVSFLSSYFDHYGRFPKECSADSGYVSEENYSFMNPLYIKEFRLFSPSL
ncbi:MAG: hypothetical protein J6W52_02950 [Bacteroidaceae bacterium]|nr:hypothetical protein [Bacteroidaceae bacterium]